MNITRQQLRRIIREVAEEATPEAEVPSLYDDVNWKEYLSDGDSDKKLKDQMIALAALSQKKFPDSDFFPAGATGGQFTITPESLSKEEATGDPAGTAFKDAYEASLERNKGLRAEDGLAAFYIAHDVPIAGIESTTGDQARQAGGEDLRIGNQIAELKTAGGSDLNLALNSTAPHDDPNRWYIFLTNRDKLPATVYVVNSQILFYRNFAKLAGVGTGGKIDSTKLEKAIKTTLSKELGGVQLEDVITKAAMGGGREEGVVLSFTLGGLSVRLRLMFTLKSKIPDAPTEDVDDLQAQDVQIDLLSGGTQGSVLEPEDPGYDFAVAASYSRPGQLISERARAIIDAHIRTTRRQYLRESSLRSLIRESLVLEELTKTDKKEIEKIARKQAKKEIDKVVGTSLEKTIQKEVEKTLKNKATKNEIADITKAVMKKFYKDLSFGSAQVIDRIKV